MTPVRSTKGRPMPAAAIGCDCSCPPCRDDLHICCNFRCSEEARETFRSAEAAFAALDRASARTRAKSRRATNRLVEDLKP